MTQAERYKTLQEMQAEVDEFVTLKGWKDDRTFGDCIALLHSELSEALEAYRLQGLDDQTNTNHVGARKHGDRCSQCKQLVYYGDDICSMAKPEGVGSEYADVFIRLLDDCERHGVDLQFEFDRKMAYNKKRPFRHGGKKL